MTTLSTRRPPRVTLPEVPQGEIMLQPPPSLPSASEGSQAPTQLLFMLPMMLGMGAMSFVYIGRGSGGGAMTWIFGALFLSSMVGMLFMGSSRGGASKKAQVNTERRDYLRYLGQLRHEVRDVARQQREALLATRPEPAQLWSLANTARLWERQIGDSDFGRVRIGLGPQRLATPLRAPQTAPLEDLDPVSSTSLRQFIRTYATVPDLPTEVSLRSFARLALHGQRSGVLDLARALLCQLVTFQSPEDLHIACCVAPERLAEWDWVKWLPHALHPSHTDSAGPIRLCAPDLTALVELLGAEITERPAFGRGGNAGGEPYLIVVMDGGESFPDAGLLPETGLHGVTVLDIGGTVSGTGPSRLDLVVEDGRLGMWTHEGVTLVGVPDALTRPEAELIARQLAPLYTGTPVKENTANRAVGLTDLLGVGDPRTVDPAVTWQRRSRRDRLRLPIGVDPDGRPVDLDLKESAEGGMGPHGLVIGATGSGKSELLRTLVTGLVLTHSSETLNLALIDFKGGATFAGMTDLPHTCAVITNLADDLGLVDRMADALRGELVRRQELLRASGNYASVRDYERAREAGVPLAPLPSLLVIIDEFSELLTSRPEFIDLFVMIGRLGRSLAVHLMLSSQRLEEGRLRGLDSHLSYRIGLRTFSTSESRAVLGVPDAYELPPIPGSAYLRIDTTTLVRFKSAYVSGAPPRTVTIGGTPQAAADQRIVPYGLAGAAEPDPAQEVAVVEEDEVDPSAPAVHNSETVMGVVLDRVRGHGPPAHQIWLPPLGEPATLDQLLPPLAATEDRGLCPPGWPDNGKLTVPVAIVDKPFEQRRDLLWADLSGAAGNAVVVGAPQSGKSTLLRTLICSLALTHTPAEVQFFVLDFGGGSLSALTRLPHVSGYAARLDAERCRRIVAEVHELVSVREQQFHQLGIDSVATMRRKPPPVDGRQFGDVFLVIDGWMTLYQEFEALAATVTTLAARGLNFGVHVVLSSNRWMDLRANIRDMIGTQFELRLGDPTDSAVDRRVAANVPSGNPGRGITRERLHFLGALPRLDRQPTTDDLADGVADLVNQIRDAWKGEPAPPVRLLPRMVPVEELPAPTPDERRIPIGIAEADLKPVYIDFAADGHLLAFADLESGKSALLRLLTVGIMSRYSAQQAAIMTVDYRRSLLGVVGDEYQLGYAASEPVLSPMVAEVVQALRARLPGPDVTPEQLRNRSWWKGPELFIMVDDYDLVATPAGNPLAALADLLPQARDIGLHLVVVRRSGGAGRAMYDPVIQRMREMGSPGLVMSGSRDEGVLLGDVKPGPQPPGRGWLVSRRTGTSLVQLGWVPPEED